MTQGNNQLRAVRERTGSLLQPGECLSRQELAELVNDHVWRHRGKIVAMDANYVGKLERGIIQWPGKLYREALRAVLNAPTDAALGFTNKRRAVMKLSEASRKTFLRAAALGAGGVALAPVMDLLEGAEPTPVPARVGSAEITQIRTAAKVFASWDHLYGGGLSREAVLAQLRWSASLLDQSDYSAQHRAPLFSAVGYLAHTFAFMAFDSYAHDDARRLFRFALACAEEAGNWRLRAKVLSSMARQAIWVGQPDEGLTLTEYALVRADRLTPTEQAMLHTAHARALAKMGRVRDTLIAAGRADDAFSHAQPANDPPWMAYYDAAQHAGDTGHALFDLAVRGRSPDTARNRLAAAVAGHSDAYPRSRMISHIKLSSLVMATGDPLEATTLAHGALDMATGIRSSRAADDLRELARYCNRHAGISEVEDLRQRVTMVVLAG
ncbi:MAG: XRE family transcriptional regulator [Pseudonocardia sp.]|nr:XRE family transcriptional regulator [Pseudonocardia sp.]